MACHIEGDTTATLANGIVRWQEGDSAGPGERRQCLPEIGDGLAGVIERAALMRIGRIAGERGVIMNNMKIRADKEARQIGIQVVDVRLKRVDYSEDISKSVFDRMIAERKRIANQLRSEGSAASEKIRADADKQREVIIADAFRDAQKQKGEGDAKAAEIYSEAYGKNPEFYAFYRSQEAYKNSFKSKSDVMVLDPKSEFFKYMRGAGGK